MKIKIFATYDSAVAAYMQPMFFQSKGAALRAWTDACKDPQTQFAKHPSDFTLFELGEYDEDTGKFTNLHVPLSLGTALEHLAADKPVTDPTLIKDHVTRIKQAVEKHSERALNS